MQSGIGNNRGLTLIEMLIVLAFLSIILAGLFNLYSFANHSFDFVEEETQRLDAARSALDLMGNDIRSAKKLEDDQVGVSVQSNGTILVLGPQQDGQIRYEVRKKGQNNYELVRQVRNGSVFVDQPGKILDLVQPSAKPPFQLNGKTVTVTLRIVYNNNRNQKPTEIETEFTVRNGLVK